MRVKAVLLLLLMCLHVHDSLEAVKRLLRAITHHAFSLIEIILNLVVTIITSRAVRAPALTITISPVLLIVFAVRHHFIVVC